MVLDIIYAYVLFFMYVRFVRRRFFLCKSAPRPHLTEGRVRDGVLLYEAKEAKGGAVLRDVPKVYGGDGQVVRGTRVVRD